ncbi:NAD(P)/FAD-dependent oxidoreductase [Undibacterium luofuense]|uniref:NAD(P)/FAD-dependent oxidoreductase n=1 Tax=Undibacterium luofuense TaxID=2828733 RepID=UPI0030EF02D4
MLNIAVIGSGLAGLTAARHLQHAGHHVTVYEKAMGVSGRMSTRQTELGGFDHGAQYFTARTDRFRKEVSDWIKHGWVAEWDARVVALEHGQVTAEKKKTARFVAVPGMNSLGKQLQHGLDVRTEHTITACERLDGQWLLRFRCPTVEIEATAGPFDRVILAVPAEQAAPLLSAVPELAAQASGVHMSPCWTMMLGFSFELNLPYDAAFVNSHRLNWIARDNSKPGHRPGERWVAQAGPAWSEEHLRDEPERVLEKMLKAFHEETGSHIQPMHAVVHRWAYAQAENPLDADYLYSDEYGIGVCGDWFRAGLDGGGKVENAFLSALSLSKKAGS